MTIPGATAIQASERTMPAVHKSAAVNAVGETAPADFAKTLSAAEQGGATNKNDPGFVHQRSKSGELKPLQRFESFVLRTFVENMLPSENTSFFGTGTAGQIWKSMLAERIGDEMAASGGIGIADLLQDRDPSVEVARDAATAAHNASIGATSAE